MKTLIIETTNPKILGELVTVSKLFCTTPDIVALGEGELPGVYGKAFSVPDTLAANICPSLTDLIKMEGYEVILLSSTAIGSGLAGLLAVGLDAPILTEVTGVTEGLVVERALYGSKAVASYKVDSGPLVLTVKRKYFEAAELEGVTEASEIPAGTQRVTLLEEIEEERKGIPLEDADAIVTGGRGIGSKDNFAMLNDLAELLNGAVGASRGAVDEGWMSPSAQIGQTGKIVAPSVYFAIGVSGASQHLAGISNAKCVVAINKDEDANIFKRARFGIVGDYKKVLPLLINDLKERS